MTINILKYLQLRIVPEFYRNFFVARVLKVKGCAGPSGKKPDDLPTSIEMTGSGTAPSSRPEEARQMAATESNSGDKIKGDNFKKKYSARRLLLVLAFSILACGLLIKYLFLWFPKLNATDMPLIGSALLIVFLSPVLYAFFYTPMIRQFDKLKRAEAKMEELALIDVLTGLYNRRGFLTYADQLLKLSDRTQRGLVLIYADLDNMKWVNDEFGHEGGDKALVTIAAVLKKTFRTSDVIGRVGGDEFAILAVEAKFENLDGLRKRLNENLRTSKYNIDSNHKLTLSLGIIYYNPEKPQAIEELLKKADMSMYEEKSFRTMRSSSPHSVRR